MSKKKVKAPARRLRVQDAFSNELARLGFDTPNLLEGTQYSMTRIGRDFQMLNSLYREHWIIRRVIATIPEDMTKAWIKITSEVRPDLLRKFDLELRKTQLINKICKGLKWGRLYGGALGVMLIKGQGEDLSQPLSIQTMVPGDFAGLMIFDRWNGCYPSGELENDICDPEFGLPEYYNVADPESGIDVKIHHSRCLRFIGNDLPYWEEIAEQYWGGSVIESVFDELRKRDNVSWNIAQLTFMANIRVLKMQDLGQLLATTDVQSQQELYKTLQAQNFLLNNMGLQVMDASDGLETHQYTFGGLADCYKQFCMDICGAAEIPATRLFGRSPEGMNSTGESDLQNYYEMITKVQEAQLRPILNKLLPVLCMSILGAVPDDLDFEFNPVRQPSDKDLVDLAKAGTENVIQAYNAGLVNQRTALLELKQQSDRTGIWTNITDADIEAANDQVEQQGEMGGMGGMSGMEEEEPPEDGNGQGQLEKTPTGESGAPRGQGQEVKQPKLPNLEVKTPAPGGAKDSDPFECSAMDDAEFESKHPRATNGEFGKGNINADLTKPQNNANVQIEKETLTVGRSVGAKAANYEVLDESTGIKYHFVEGQTLQVETFAGKGHKSLEDKVKDGLCRENPGTNPDDWVHCKVKAYLDVNGESVKADIHWFQVKGGPKVKFKVKEWLFDED